MTDDRDDDAAEWLSARFAQNDEVENADARRPPAGKSAERPPAEKLPSEKPAEEPAAEKSAEGTRPAGGFAWGLAPARPGEDPPPLVEPPAARQQDASGQVAGEQDGSGSAISGSASSEQTDSDQRADQQTPSVHVPTGPQGERQQSEQAGEQLQGEQQGEQQPPWPQPFDGSLAGGPSNDAEPPTMAMPWEGADTELFTPVAASTPVAEPATELLSGFDTAAADAAADSSVEALFGESQFREYATGPLLAARDSTSPAAAQPGTAAPATAAAALPARPRRARQPRSQKVLLWIAGCLVALLVLIGLFVLGTTLPDAGAAPVEAPSATPTPTPSATPTPVPTGVLEPGTYKWNLLRGGECLAPFDSAWAEEFTVVTCATPHPAQLVARGTFAPPPPSATDPSAPATDAATGQGAAEQEAAEHEPAYPGAEALQARADKLCRTPVVINFTAAGAYRDILVSVSYPADEKQWADGDRDYYCFVTRSSGDPFKGSLSTASK